MQLSKECRKEMQYYKLLAKEVEKRIQTLKPLIIDSDTESNEDKTDAPDLPESEQSYDIPSENDHNGVKEKYLEVEESTGRLCNSNTYDNLSSNLTADTESISSKLSSKLVIDLSLSINETGRNLIDSPNSSQTLNDLPERDCVCPQRKSLNTDSSNTIKDDKLSFSLSINKDAVPDQIATIHFSQDGPSSLSSKSFTGSLNDIHKESVKESPNPLIRQRSYTLLKPSPVLMAHLEVQSINTGMDVTSISMSESMSNISYSNKKRRSWDLESAKEKWSSMALELKEKNVPKSIKNGVKKPLIRKMPQSAPPRAKSLALDKVKRSPPKPSSPKTEPLHKPKKTPSPVVNSAQNNPKQTNTVANQKKDESVKKPIAEEDPATRVRELYEKIQKQQLIQMANLVEKQKKEQMLLQQVFEEQNNLLFTQLKTICPKSPNEVKEAWSDMNKEASRGPVSLSQLINNKPTEHSESPVISTLTETKNYLNYCDNVLKKSRDITSGMKKQTHKNTPQIEKSPKPSDGSRTRTHSPVRRNTPTSRKLVYETSVSSGREYEPLLTDRTNDTMADLNVTFPSDEECHPFLQDTVIVCADAAQNSIACRPNDNTLNNINSMCLRQNNVFRAPTAQEVSLDQFGYLFSLVDLYVRLVLFSKVVKKYI